MQIDPSVVGHRIDAIERTLSWRETTNYAAAVGDANPRFLDDTQPGGLVAHPLFATALTWPLMETFRENLPPGVPGEAILSMVHASERLTLHRAIRPGDKLTISGHIADRIVTSAGTLLVLESRGVDSHETPVFTEQANVLFRGVGADKELKSKQKIENPVFGKEPDWSHELPISPTLPFVYDGCSDIVFPIHTSVGFAKMVGLPGIIVQGTALLALAASALMDRCGSGNPERLLEIGCGFRSVVVPDQTVSLNVWEISQEDGTETVVFEMLDANGKKALIDGHARFSAS